MTESLSNVFEEVAPGLFYNGHNGVYCRPGNGAFVVLDETDPRVVAYQEQQGNDRNALQLGGN